MRRSGAMLKTSGARIASRVRSSTSGDPLEDCTAHLQSKLDQLGRIADGMDCAGMPKCASPLPMGKLGILRTVAMLVQDITKPLRDADEFHHALGVYRRATQWLLQLKLITACVHDEPKLTSRLRDLADAEAEANIECKKEPPSYCRAMMCFQFVYERILLTWDLLSDECVELVRLGDRYLRIALWKQAEKAYSEAAGLLVLLACLDYHQEIPQLARLAPMGLSHSLFAQRKFMESAAAVLVGIRFFPTFPQLSMNPSTLFPSPSEYSLVLDDLESQAHAEREDETNSGCQLQFLLAFQYHTVGKHAQAKEIMLPIRSCAPETSFFLQYYERYSALDGVVPVSDVQNVKSLSEDRILSVVRGMMDREKGVSVANRRYRLKVYNQCFIGYEAVDWLVDQHGLTREKAVEFGKLLMARRIIFHVVSQQPFADDYFFYHFAPVQLHTPPLKSGYMMKKGSIAWFRRWVELRKGTFTYYASESASRPSRLIPLDGGGGDVDGDDGGDGGTISSSPRSKPVVMVQCVAEAGREHCFQFCVGEECMVFSVETNGQLSAWLEAFEHMGGALVKRSSKAMTTTTTTT